MATATTLHATPTLVGYARFKLFIAHLVQMMSKYGITATPADAHIMIIGWISAIACCRGVRGVLLSIGSLRIQAHKSLVITASAANAIGMRMNAVTVIAYMSVDVDVCVCLVG